MSKASSKYRCKVCHSTNVICEHTHTAVEHQAVDERGRVIYESKTDKQTGKSYEAPVMIKQQARSLGTWHCHGKCAGAKVAVERC